MTTFDSDIRDTFKGLFMVYRDGESAAPIQSVSDALTRAAANTSTKDPKEQVPVGGYLFSAGLDGKKILGLYQITRLVSCQPIV